MCLCVSMGSNKTTIPVTMATGELELIHTLKQRVSNNKHPLYKYANWAYLLLWVGSRRRRWWKTTHQWTWFSSDKGWILEVESPRCMKRDAEEKLLSWFSLISCWESSSGCLDLQVPGVPLLVTFVTCLLCFRAFSCSDTPPRICILRITAWRLERHYERYQTAFQSSKKHLVAAASH